MLKWSKVVSMQTRLVFTWSHPCCLEGFLEFSECGWVSMSVLCKQKIQMTDLCVSYINQVLNVFHSCIVAEDNHLVESSFFNRLCLLKWNSPDFTLWLIYFAPFIANTLKCVQICVIVHTDLLFSSTNKHQIFYKHVLHHAKNRHLSEIVRWH